MAGVKCNQGCFLKGKDCKARRSCACKCGPLKVINPSLFDGCVDACNVSNANERPKGPQDYKCNFVGPDALFTLFQIVESDCGFELEDTTYCKTNPNAEGCAKEPTSTINLKMVAGGMVAGIVVILFFILRR